MHETFDPLHLTHVGQQKQDLFKLGVTILENTSEYETSQDDWNTLWQLLKYVESHT